MLAVLCWRLERQNQYWNFYNFGVIYGERTEHAVSDWARCILQEFSGYLTVYWRMIAMIVNGEVWGELNGLVVPTPARSSIRG